MDIKLIDPNKFVKWSPLERKYIVFGLDGMTIIGRSHLKESGIAQFNAFILQRNKLVNKGLAKRDRTESGVRLDTKGTLTSEQQEMLNKVEAARRNAGLLDEIERNEENITPLFDRSKNRNPN